MSFERQNKERNADAAHATGRTAPAASIRKRTDDGTRAVSERYLVQQQCHHCGLGPRSAPCHGPHHFLPPHACRLIRYTVREHIDCVLGQADLLLVRVALGRINLLEVGHNAPHRGLVVQWVRLNTIKGRRVWLSSSMGNEALLHYVV